MLSCVNKRASLSSKIPMEDLKVKSRVSQRPIRRPFVARSIPSSGPKTCQNMISSIFLFVYSEPRHNFVVRKLKKFGKHCPRVEMEIKSLKNS